MIFSILYLVLRSRSEDFKLAFRIFAYINQQKSFEQMRNGDTPKITVAIRKRPLNKRQLQRSEADIIRVGNSGQVTVSEYKQKVDLTKYLQETTFNFDYAYDQYSNNQQIYEQSIRPLIDNAFMGAKISCFAYGQTGSGKTFTMKGDMNKGVPGLYYLGASQIFQYLEQANFRHLHATVSFYEIYCGRLYDLLNNRAQLKIRQDKKQNINVIGMEEKPIYGANQFLDLIEYGSNFRVTSQNATNADSSRSHAILQIALKHDKKMFTKISFIDLAGNQRGADHIDQNKQTKIDGAEINKSLLSLKECIRALDQGKGHTPFRGSKLTMVLKDSFVGFCNTVMICNVSPNSSSSENTMNTLRYADRVKELRSGQGQHLSKEEQIARQLMLPRANNKNCIKVNIQNNDDQDDILLKMEEARQQNYNKKKVDYEEKMDIEEPIDNRKLFAPNVGRKTENISNQMKLLNMAQKRGQVIQGREIKSIRMQSSTNLFRGRQPASEVEKQPLHSRNVRSSQVDQNNLNFANNFSQDFDANKRNMSKNLKSPNTETAKNHFEAMTGLRRDFELYREDHQNLIKSEMNILKQEMSMKEGHRRGPMGGSYQEEIGDLSGYLDRMQGFVRQKLELFNQMQDSLDRMRSVAKNAQNLTFRLRQEQEEPQRGLNSKVQNKYYVHSSLNNINFNGFGNYNHHYGDEQLLQGLPGDEVVTRLF